MQHALVTVSIKLSVYFAAFQLHSLAPGDFSATNSREMEGCPTQLCSLLPLCAQGNLPAQPAVAEGQCPLCNPLLFTALLAAVFHRKRDCKAGAHPCMHLNLQTSVGVQGASVTHHKGEDFVPLADAGELLIQVKPLFTPPWDYSWSRSTFLPCQDQC